MKMAMFQQPPRPNGTVHVEFRAGRMDWDGRMVTADKTKGKVVLMTSEDEQLMHFQWFDRTKPAQPVTDLIVINDAYLEKIEQCKTGRVYLLRFTSSNKKLFFWMQEPKDDKDGDLVTKFNETIGAKIPEKGAPKPAAGAAPPAAAAAAANQQNMDPAIQAIVQQFIAAQGGAGAARTPPVPLQTVLTTEVLQSLASDEAAVAEMSSLLPPGHQGAEDVKETLSSPQLQQSLAALSQAIHSDQLPVLFASLGLDPSVIASAPPGSDALELLIKAMEAKLGENKP